MGIATNNIITTLRSTGRGSDYFGICDQCGKHLSECFVLQHQREYRRPNGSLYYSPMYGGAYGHEACLEALGNRLVNDQPLAKIEAV